MMSSPRALVAGHGDFAECMVAAVSLIAGRGEVFAALSNRDLSAAGVEEAMRRVLEQEQIGVVFTDLPAGSCTMAARRIQRDRPNLTIVVGANLGSLLDFVFHEDMPAAEAARRAAERGRSSLMVIGGGPEPA
ncbi:MAG: PTS sugar transporter subunit IIA [Gemmatimonadota bacterium]